MNWMNDHYVTPQAIRRTIRLLEQAEVNQEKVLLFGGWVQLHAVAQKLHSLGQIIRLSPGSLLGTGGGLKEQYAFPPEVISQELGQMIKVGHSQPMPVRDVYGMAEGNWAAMQCDKGNYHIPPWIYALTLDEDNQVQTGSDVTGLLAFFDPYGGGNLFPAFFKSADRLRLINSSGHFDPSRVCACGEQGTYITRDSIQRVDLMDEAGCAAQV